MIPNNNLIIDKIQSTKDISKNKLFNNDDGDSRTIIDLNLLVDLQSYLLNKFFKKLVDMWVDKYNQPDDIVDNIRFQISDYIKFISNFFTSTNIPMLMDNFFEKHMIKYSIIAPHITDMYYDVRDKIIDSQVASAEDLEPFIYRDCSIYKWLDIKETSRLRYIDIIYNIPMTSECIDDLIKTLKSVWDNGNVDIRFMKEGDIISEGNVYNTFFIEDSYLLDNILADVPKVNRINTKALVICKGYRLEIEISIDNVKIFTDIKQHLKDRGIMIFILPTVGPDAEDHGLYTDDDYDEDLSKFT